jgi:hypothetical protein
LYLIAQDRTRASEMGLAGRIRMEQEFSEETTARMYDELYRGLLDARCKDDDHADWD